MLKRFISIGLILLCSCGRAPQQDRFAVIGISGDTDSLNPLLTKSRFGMEISSMLFLNLMEEQPDLVTFEPEFARSWETLEQGRVIRFHLRGDMFWSDSVRATAHDVKFTHDLQIDPEVGWSGASVKQQIEAVQVVDDTTVQFVLKAPYRDQLMDINEGAILPKHVLESEPPGSLRESDFNRNPVGMGPFRLKSWVSNQHIELVRNELYHSELQPRITGVIFKIVPDKTQLVQQLQTHEVDLVEGIPAQELSRLERREDVRIDHFPYAQYVQIAWNLDRPLFQNRAVRRALTGAIDRDALVQHLLKGYGRICTGPVHPMLWAYNADLQPLPYDPEEARAGFEKAGWLDSDGDGVLDRDGVDFEFTLTTNLGSQVREDALVMVQEMLRKVGVRVIPAKLEWTVYVEKLTARDFDAVLIGMMSATKVDLFPTWHSSMTGPNGFNLSNYRNARVDELIERAREIGDLERAIPLYTELQDIIREDQPATFLWVPDRTVAMSASLKGCRFSPVSTYFNIDEWYFD